MFKGPQYDDVTTRKRLAFPQICHAPTYIFCRFTGTGKKYVSCFYWQSIVCYCQRDMRNR